jgi:hypothetical protein
MTTKTKVTLGSRQKKWREKARQFAYWKNI